MLPRPAAALCCATNIKVFASLIHFTGISIDIPYLTVLVVVCGVTAVEKEEAWLSSMLRARSIKSALTGTSATSGGTSINREVPELADPEPFLYERRRNSRFKENMYKMHLKRRFDQLVDASNHGTDCNGHIRPWNEAQVIPVQEDYAHGPQQTCQSPGTMRTVPWDYAHNPPGLFSESPGTVSRDYA